MQILIGQVYNMEGFDYKKNGEDRRRVTFRLGMDKPYKVEKTINGEKKEVREKTFITGKCFNGLSETLEKYFAGDDNKGRWIQVSGHYEEEEFEREIEIEHPEDENLLLELPVKTKQLVFIVSNFAFVGPAPDIESKPKPTGNSKTKVKVKTKVKDGVNADDAQKDLATDDTEEDAPF